MHKFCLLLHPFHLNAFYVWINYSSQYGTNSSFLNVHYVDVTHDTIAIIWCIVAYIYLCMYMTWLLKQIQLMDQRQIINSKEALESFYAMINIAICLGQFKYFLSTAFRTSPKRSTFHQFLFLDHPPNIYLFFSKKKTHFISYKVLQMSYVQIPVGMR